MSLSAASEEEPREVVVAELQPDATWKLIQQNTFTRWVNQKLKVSDITIKDLGTDFNEGLKLIRLVEVLSGKLLSKYNKKAVFRSQKLENISLALEFLQKEEHIKIINIDSTAIADGNLKLILGLVWTLILHYSISKQVWDDEYATAEAEPSERTPKQKLMQWIKMKLPPGLPFNNFTSDWNDGVLLGALVDACVPDVGLDWRHWLPSRALESTRAAMDVASSYLDVAPLITPEELINPAVDEKSVMTYLAQFPQARCIRSSQYNDDGNRANDFLVERSPPVGFVSSFRVRMASGVLDPDVTIRNPDGNLVELKLIRLSPTGYQVSYTPTMVGTHEVVVLERDLAKQQSRAVFTDKVNAVRGPQLKYARNVRLGKSALLKVEGAPGENIEMAVVDPNGQDHMLSVDSAGVAVFVPTLKGVHSLNVFYKKQPVDGSPFPLIVEPPGLTVWGRGIVQEGLRVGDEASVNVDADEDLSLTISTRVQTEAGEAVPVEEMKSVVKPRRTFVYRPRVEGKHEVNVTCGDEVMSYRVPVGPRSSCAVRAFGPGLETGVCGQPGVFFVETNGDSDSLGFSIAGPKKTQISCTDNGDGSAVVQYTPEEQGVYQVNVFCQGEHIYGSPFALMVEPAVDWLRPDSVRVLGLDANTRIVQGDKTLFRIDTSRMIKKLAPEVRILDREYSMLPLEIIEREPAIYDCCFTPELEGRHYFSVAVGGVAVEGFPLALNVRKRVDPNEVRVYGPGVGNDVRSQQPTHFFINAKGAGPGEVEVALRDDQGSAVDVDVLDNTDGSFTVKYTAPRPGAYELSVVFAGVEVPRIEINVKPHVDVSGIRVEGLENENVLLGHCKEITVDTNHLTATSRGLQVITENTDGEKFLMKLKADDRGLYTGVWTAQKYGRTKFSVLFDEVLVREATTYVLEGQDASKCRASGDGLTRAYVGEPAKFRIDTQGAGEGAVELSISGPSESKTSVRDHSNGSCTVEYVPMTAGIYHIKITYGEKKDPIPGSPFVAVVDFLRDPSRILVKECERDTRIGIPKRLLVDATRTAAAPVEARLPPKYEQPVVEEIEARLYSVTFTPSGRPGDIMQLALLYDGEPFPESSLEFKVKPECEPDLVKVKSYIGGPFSPDVLASLPAKFLIDVTEAGKGGKLVAEVKGPDGKLRRSSIAPFTSQGPGIYCLEFVPDIAGAYDVRLFLNDQATSPSPYRVRAMPVGDASKCIVKGLPTEEYWAVGEPKKFSVDVSEAGGGALSVLPSRELEVDVHTETSDNGRDCLITLIPLTTGPHIVNLLYGGRDIANGTIRFECLREPEAITSGAEEQILYRTEEFDEAAVSHTVSPPLSREFVFSVDSEFIFDRLTATVTMPSGKHDIPRIQDNHDGTITVNYQPSQYGHHLLSVQHDGVSVPGSPLSFYVDHANKGFVTVYGPGLSHAVVGEPAAFTVCTKGIPAKELTVKVEGVAKANIMCHDNKDGTCAVAWVPPVPGEYKIFVKLAGEPVKYSPFTVLVAGEGQKRAHLSVGSTSEVSLNIAAPELKGLSASIKSPLGIEEPCFIRQIDPTHIGVSFTPREAGEHLITVKRNGVVLPKAPFRVKVDQSQIGDASKVLVSGPGLANAVCQKFNDITVDTRNAGFGGLSVSVEGPSKCELNCKEAKNGLINIAYRPTEPGIYILSVKFADIHVKDSPFTVNCTGEGVGAVKQEISKDAPQASMVMPAQDATLYLQLPNTNPMDMTAKLMNPKGRSEDIEMRDVGDNFYQIKFKPEMEGLHAVSVFHRDQHVNGSPFQFTVGHFEEGGAHKVRAGGVGLQRAETNTKQSFNLYTREAGKGKLEVSMEGPSKAELNFVDHKDGNCHVDYKVVAPGVYIISVLFNGEHVPDSPFKVFVAPATGEARRLELASFPDSGLPGKACTFTILTHGAPGHLEGKIQTPSNNIETVDIVPIDEGESYAFRFIPHETGNYYVDVTLDGAPMRGSPFRMRIGAREENDPTAITATGDGLHSGQTGQKCEFMINTCNAGSGLLQVQIDGPSKVTLDAYELEMGYKVRYMALAPGAYYASIRYSGIHIPGSPFKINVSGKTLGGSGEPDSSMVKIDALAKTSKGTVTQAPVYTGVASKVVAKGAGLNKFFPGRPAVFNIETGLAGPNLLFVGVVTTKGPCEEVSVKHMGSGSYTVQYRIQERAKGFIFIKYGDEPIPGSPFAISF